MSPREETIERRLIQTRFLDGWLGPASDDKTYCAATVGGIEFDADEPAHVAPFTVEEVKGDFDTVPPVEGVGYVELRIAEVGRIPDGATSGIDDATGKFVSSELILLNLEFALRIPVEADVERFEIYKARIDELFFGLAIVHEGPPRVTLRNRMKYPSRRRPGEIIDGSWRLVFYDVKVEARERRQHAGTVAVSLPS